MRTPDNVEDARDGLPPCRAVLAHLPPSDTDEGFDAVTETGSRARRDGEDVAVVCSARRQRKRSEGETTTKGKKRLHDLHIVSSITKAIARTTTQT
jgi:hypothetical protein